MKRLIWRMIGAGILVALVMALFAYWYGFLRKEKSIERMKPDFVLTADSLFSVFSADENSATEKYGGKIVLLRSRLVSVERDDNGNVALILVDPMMGVTCTLDSLQAVRQKSEIEELKEGDQVSVKGRCDGMLMDVKISKCMIVK